MQLAEFDSAPVDTGPTAINRLNWRPVSLWVLLGRTDTTSVATLSIWFAIIGLCVWWSLYGEALSWNPSQFTFLGLPGLFELYLPWVIGLLLIMWLGFEWAAVPVYLTTLFSNLSDGVSWQIAVINALHNPLGMAVFFLVYSWLPKGYSLRSARSCCVFACSALLAALTTSIGAIIWKLNVWHGGPSLLSAWIAWWLNLFLLSVVLAAPLIFWLSPAVERFKQRHLLAASARNGLSLPKLLIAASLFVLTAMLVIVANDHWQRAQIEPFYTSIVSPELRNHIVAELGEQHLVVWVLAALLAAISVGGLMVAHYWGQHLRAQADSRTRSAELARQSSEVRFRHFFQANPAPMWVYNPRDGRFLDVNDAAQRQYGYTREDFLRMSIYDVCPPQEAERLKKIRATETADRNWAAGEWQHRRKDGGTLDVEVSVSSLRMDGRVVHLALMHDVSSQRHAQAAMEQRARELHILAAASLEMAGAQSIGQLLQISVERARQLLGTQIAVARCRRLETQDEIVRRVSLSPSYAAQTELRTVVDDMGVCKLLAEKHSLRLTRNELLRHPLFETAQAHVAEQLPLAGLLAVPLTAADKATGILVVSDKTQGEFDAQDEALLVQLAQIASAGIENLHLNEALRQHMQALEQRVTERTAELDSSNRELDAFAYSVAHDLRAPLRAMHGFANAVLEDHAPVLDSSGRNYLERIIVAAHNMDTLIQDLLAYSRIGRAHLVLEAVPVDEAVRDALEALAGEVKSSLAKINVDVPPLLVEAHRGTLKQVILNLVSNAIKFVAAGVRPEVTIQARAESGRVRVAIADNGIGIAHEHQERIFNVFERLHGAETYPGTGVGLSIVKKGLARMHGEISVESNGSGSIFTAILKEFRHE